LPTLHTVFACPKWPLARAEAAEGTIDVVRVAA